MFKLLSVSAFLSLLAGAILISTPTKSEIFTMPFSLLCDDAKEITEYIDKEGYILVASGLTQTFKGQIFIGIYSHKENLIILGVDPEGYACFIAEINESLEWEFDMKKNLPEPKNKSPKIRS